MMLNYEAKMSKIARLVISVLTLVTLLLSVAGMVWSVIFKIPIVFVTCLLLGLIISSFCYRDYLHYFGKK
jgi:hypothetical protein